MGTEVLQPFVRTAARVREMAQQQGGDFLRCFGLLAPIAAAQVLLAWRPRIGVFAVVAAIAAYTIVAARTGRGRKVAISLGVLPVILVCNLALPQSSAFGQAIVFYDSMLLLALVYRFFFTLDQPLITTRLQWKGYATLLPLMLFVGQALGLLAFWLLRFHYPFAAMHDWGIIAGATAVFAFAEEMFFRGLVQQVAMRWLRGQWALVLTVGLTFLVSLTLRSVPASMYAVVAASALSLTYYFKQNLLLTFTMNAAAKLLFLGLLATFVL